MINLLMLVPSFLHKIILTNLTFYEGYEYRSFQTKNMIFESVSRISYPFEIIFHTPLNYIFINQNNEVKQTIVCSSLIIRLRLTFEEFIEENMKKI